MSNKIKVKSMRCTLKDFKEVQQILSHPSVLKTNDDNPEATDDAAETVLRSSDSIVLKPRKNTLFLFVPVNYIMYDTHIAMAGDEARSHGAKSFVRAVRWMFKNTRAQKLIGYVPSHYQAVAALTKSLGGVEEGRVTKSFLQGGVLQDLVILGITKESFIEKHGGV